MASRDRTCVIVGAGPAGLTAAYELSKLELHARRFLYQAEIGAALESVDESEP